MTQAYLHSKIRLWKSRAHVPKQTTIAAVEPGDVTYNYRLLTWSDTFQLLSILFHSKVFGKFAPLICSNLMSRLHLINYDRLLQTSNTKYTRNTEKKPVVLSATNFTAQFLIYCQKQNNISEYRHFFHFICGCFDTVHTYNHRRGDAYICDSDVNRPSPMQCEGLQRKPWHS